MMASQRHPKESVASISFKSQDSRSWSGINHLHVAFAADQIRRLALSLSHRLCLCSCSSGFTEGISFES